MRIAFAENNAEFQKNWSENWITTLQDLVGEIAQITGQITDLFSQAFQVAADNQLASLERLTAQEQEQLNASLVNREITDKQYEEKKKLLEKSAINNLSCELSMLQKLDNVSFDNSSSLRAFKFIGYLDLNSLFSLK